MSGTGRVVLGVALLVSIAVVTNHSAANFEPPEWAYPSTPRNFNPNPDDGKPKRLAASTKAYTYAQLQDVFAAPDWYPTAHPKMPDVVRCVQHLEDALRRDPWHISPRISR